MQGNTILHHAVRKQSMRTLDVILAREVCCVSSLCGLPGRWSVRGRTVYIHTYMWRADADADDACVLQLLLLPVCDVLVSSTSHSCLLDGRAAYIHTCMNVACCRVLVFGITPALEPTNQRTNGSLVKSRSGTAQLRTRERTHARCPSAATRIAVSQPWKKGAKTSGGCSVPRITGGGTRTRWHSRRTGRTPKSLRN